MAEIEFGDQYAKPMDLELYQLRRRAKVFGLWVAVLRHFKPEWGDRRYYFCRLGVRQHIPHPKRMNAVEANKHLDRLARQANDRTRTA